MRKGKIISLATRGLSSQWRSFLVVLAGAAVLAFAAPQQKQKQAELLLIEAINKEVVEGDLQQAIELYKQVISKFSSERPVVARALLRLGEGYEKLGKPEAQEVYQRVLRDYADQLEMTAAARSRIAALGAPAAPDGTMAARRILTGGRGYFVSPSPDGRYLVFSPYSDLFVRDLRGGTDRRLTSRESPGDYAERSVVSPDSRQVAYAWFDSKAGRWDLRVVPLAGAEAAHPRIVHRRDETRWVAPYGWTPDGQGLLGVRQLEGGTNQIARISVADGSVRALKSFGWVYPGWLSLSPDGRYVAYALRAEEGVRARDIFLLAADGSQETIVVQNPADDHRPLWSPDGSHILFVSNRTGQDALWTIQIEAGKPRDSAELVKADFSFRPVGITRNGVLYGMSGGYFDNIYIADVDDKLNTTAPPYLAIDRFLNSNYNPAYSPDGQYLAYLSRRRPGRRLDSLALVIRSVQSGEEREVPMKIRPAHQLSPLRWFPDGHSVLVPSRNNLQPQRLGYYRVHLESGNAELLHIARIYNRATRQTDLSPDGKSIFYLDGDAVSAGSDGAPHLMRFDIDSGQAAELKRALSGGFGSLAVSPDGSQLAYLRYDRPTQSRVLEVIPLTGGEARELFRENGQAAPTLFSGLAWTPDQHYLLFVRPESNPERRETGNEADDPQKTALWRVPVTGGQPEKTGISMEGWLRIMRLHPDGRRLAFSLRQQGSREVWAMENFLPELGSTK